MQPIRILIATDNPFSAAVRWYRTQGPVSAFPRDRFTFTVANIRELIAGEEWAWGAHDVLLVEKYWTPEAVDVMGIAKMYGMKVWIDTDDDKQNVPQYNDFATNWSGEKQKAELIILKMADLLTVSTPALKRVYGGANKNIVVVPNAWNDYLLSPSPIAAQSKPVKMAWRGSSQGHAGDLEEVRRPLAAAFNSPAMRWRFYGSRPPVWLKWGKEHFDKFRPLAGWFHTLSKERPDWLFVPLCDNPFNCAKSDCSAIEANMLAGAGVIAPMYLPEFNRPGVVRYKDNKHLESIFEQIRKGGIDKAQVAAEGQKYIAENRTLSRLNGLRVQALIQLFSAG